jgi:hypothetical protein
MLRQALLSVAVLLAGVAAPVQAQEVKLQWKFKEGEKIYVEDVMNKKTILSVQGQPIKSEQKTTFIISYTVKKATSASTILVMKFEDVEVRTESGVGGAFDKIMEKMKGATFTITLTPDGKITKFEGFQDLVKQLAAADENTAKLIRAIVNEAMVTSAVEQAFGFLPDKAVKKGETWTREGTLPLGPLGDFKSANTYTYNGKTENGEAIGVQQTMRYIPPKGGDLAGLFKIVRGDLKAKKAETSYIFDAEKGRLVSATLSTLIHGTLTVDFTGMETQVELSMDTTGTSRVLDKNPVKN